MTAATRKLEDHAAATPSLGVQLHVRRFAYKGGPGLLADLAFAAPAGQWTCLLGPSGVGKTTLLRLLAGLMPDDGEVSAATDDGRPLRGLVSYMAQQDLLLPWLSAEQNVLLGARLRGEARDGQRARALLEQVGVADQRAARPAQLSGGQRQRVALARTLMEDRPVVLMDEPFSAVDAITRQRLQTLAAGLLRGRTVVLITHDPQEALRLGHQVLVMAGQPARLSPVPMSYQPTPRDIGEPELVRLHGHLLGRLGAALDSAADGEPVP